MVPLALSTSLKQHYTESDGLSLDTAGQLGSFFGIAETLQEDVGNVLDIGIE